MLSHYPPEKNQRHILMKGKFMKLEVEQNMGYFEGATTEESSKFDD
jgi:hypothetical protein